MWYYEDGYNLIKGKKYYGRYSKTITVSFAKKKS